jgi:hypothetical protein
LIVCIIVLTLKQTDINIYAMGKFFLGNSAEVA